MNSNIRQMLRCGVEEKIRQTKNDISFTILYLANSYTGANYKNPPNQSDLASLRTCTNFVCDMYPQISINELELAFKLAAAGKFDGVNLETYFGKFTVTILGKILKAYTQLRNKVIIQQGKLIEQEMKEQEKQLEKILNDKTQKDIVSKFTDLRALFLNHGEIPQKENINAYWAKILINTGHIEFTDKEKNQIWFEAKELTTKENKASLHSSTTTSNQKQSMRAILRAIAGGDKHGDFENKCIKNYSKLLILKSIIK